MENLKLISLRVDPLVIQRMEKFVLKHYYWKKSSVMAALLYWLSRNADDDTLFRMIQSLNENPSRYQIQLIENQYTI